MIDFIQAKFEDFTDMQYYLSKVKDSEIIYKAKYSGVFSDTSFNANIWNYKNFNIKITNSQGFVENSLHSYYNMLNGFTTPRNYNDFSYSQICTALDKLQEKLNYPLGKMFLSSHLEFGFNIKPSFPILPFITSECLLLRYKTHFKFDDENKIFKVFKSGDFAIKIYYKSKQFGIEENILRIELVITKKKAINDLGIFTMADLKDKNLLKKLFDKLMDYINSHMMIVDNIKERGFSKFIENKILAFCSFKKWDENRVLTRRQQDKEKLEAKKYFKKHQVLCHHQEIIGLLNYKFSQLIDS